jgi:hypothetical protein
VQYIRRVVLERKAQAIEYLKSPQRPDTSARSKVLESALGEGSCTELYQLIGLHKRIVQRKLETKRTTQEFLRGIL